MIDMYIVYIVYKVAVIQNYAQNLTWPQGYITPYDYSFRSVQQYCKMLKF
jgi:hypothetical protein